MSEFRSRPQKRNNMESDQPNTDSQPPQVSVGTDAVATTALGNLLLIGIGIAAAWCLAALGWRSASAWLCWIALLYVYIHTARTVLQLFFWVWINPAVSSRLAVTLLCLMPCWIAYLHFSRSYASAIVEPMKVEAQDESR